MTKKKTGRKSPEANYQIEHMEIPHNTQTPGKKTKCLYDYYQDIVTWRNMPVNDAWLQKMCEDMVSSAINDPDFLIITQFYHKRGFGNEDMARWMERNEFVKKAHDKTLSILGDKRELGALKNKMNAGMVMYSMPLFKKEWKHLAEWRASLKQEKEQAQNTVVVIEKFPSSDIVPEKKDDT